MVKKLWIVMLIMFGSFTSVNAQTPDNYQTIVFDTWANPNTELGVTTDLVYQDLWTFINFRQSYIEIDGVTVVSNGTPIPEATFLFKVSGGQHFELIYNDYKYRFALENVDYSDIGFFANYTIAITPEQSGDTVPNDTNLILSLPSSGAILQPEASESFLALITGYGLNNPVGLLLIFFVTILAINIAIVALKLPSMVYITVNLAVGSGFMFFNLIPLWAGFIFTSIMILFLILSFRGSKI